MNSNRKVVLFVAFSSAILGVIATQIYQDSITVGGQGKTLSRKTDPHSPPIPDWRKTDMNDSEQMVDENTVANAEASTRKNPKPSLENPPAVNQIREEVAKDPHTTPQSLLAFAEELSANMQGAFSDRETRYSVSRQLMTCARDAHAKGSAQAARALCLYNLERLKDRFPDELSPSYQSLLAELPEDLIFVAGVAKNSGEKSK